MGLRCSLLGHDYGESEIERDREEQGSEVVVTVQEFQVCSRCGDEKVVSENKEVTSIDQPEPSGTDTDSEAGDDVTIVETDADSPADREPADREPADSVATPDSEPAPNAGSGTSSPSPAVTSTAGADAHDPGMEDAEILEDDEDEVTGEREYGQWPDSDDVDGSGSESTPWPDHGGDDEGFDAEPNSGGSTEISFGGGLTPEEVNVEDEEGFEFVGGEDTAETRTKLTSGTGITSAREAPNPNDGDDESGPDSEFVCPQCDYVEAAAGSSLRAGDICPECRRGYLAKE